MTTRQSLYNGVPIPYDDKIENLWQILKTPGPQAWAACRALGHKTDKAAFKILEELAASDDWRYRRIAIEAMAIHKLASTRAAFFCEYLMDLSPYVVRTACQVVADLEIYDARDSLRELVLSNSDDTRSVALRALKDLWQPSDFDLVFSVFQSDVSKLVRREAAWTLRSNVDKSSWEPLFEIWRTDPLPRHRVWACELVCEFGNKSYTQILQVMFKDKDGHVRGAVNRALEELSS